MTVAFHPPTPARGSTELAEVQDALFTDQGRTLRALVLASRISHANDVLPFDILTTLSPVEGRDTLHAFEGAARALLEDFSTSSCYARGAGCTVAPAG